MGVVTQIDNAEGTRSAWQQSVQRYTSVVFVSLVDYSEQRIDATWCLVLPVKTCNCARWRRKRAEFMNSFLVIKVRSKYDVHGEDSYLCLGREFSDSPSHWWRWRGAGRI